MAIGTAAAIGIGTTVASAATGIAGAAMAPEPESGRLALPPELELQFMEQSQRGLDVLNRDIQRTQSLERSFNQRMNTLDQMIQGTIPTEQAVNDLQNQTRELATAFGGDTQALIESGFLTDDIRTELEDLRALEAEDFQDPELTRELQEQRSQLAQDLQRQGVRGAQFRQQMERFDQFAREEQFTRAEELRTGRTQRGVTRIQAGLGAREAGFQRALGGAQFGQSALEQLFGQRQTGVEGLFQTGGARLQAGQQAIEQRAGLTGQAQQQFGQMGQFNFSGQLRDALASGLVGPGSAFQQTGVASRDIDDLLRQRREQEEAISGRRLGLTATRNAQGFQQMQRTKQAERLRNQMGGNLDVSRFIDTGEVRRN
jgi:hypothetical protein